MKTWAKVTLGILAVPVILLAGGLTILVATGRWTKVTGLAGGALRIKRSSDGLKALNREYPFTPPADGQLSEARLGAYLEVCGAVQPLAEPFGAWVRAHQGQKGGLDEAQAVATQLGGLLEVGTRALKEQRLSMEEFQWITLQVREARREVAAKAGSPLAREMLDTLRRLQHQPGLPAPERQRLARSIDQWEGNLRRTGQPLSFNGELYLKHAERIRALDVDGLFEALAESGRHRRDGREP